MKVIRYALLVGLISIFLGCISQPASAHVLIVDTTESKGAILHINPDDNPVAGESSGIIFDTENNLINSSSQVWLRVKDQTGQSTRIKMKIDKSFAVAEYTFPARGLYNLSFEIKNKSATATFEVAQRVSRGVSASGGDANKHEWAEALLVASVVAILSLAILAYNNRRDIGLHSTF